MKKSTLSSLVRPAFASFACFVVSLIFPGFLFAAAPADFAATRAVLGADLAEPRLVQVRLDAPLFAATRPGFPDLRLFDAAGQELPRLIEPLYTTQERIVRRPVAARPACLQELPDNRIEARFELQKDELPPVGIEIRTPLRDFIRTVRITGSEDGQTWQTLVADAQIYDYSRYMDIRRTEIALPPNACRHFSIEIGNASEERAQPLIRLVQANGQDQSRAFDLLQTPFRIDGVSFWREETVLDKDQLLLQEWPHAGMDVAQDPKAKTTEIVLQTAYAPVTRLELETPARNFQRTAGIQIPELRNGQKAWRTVGNGQFTRIDVSGLATNALAIDFPEQRAAEIRLVIQNHDNPPLDIPMSAPPAPSTASSGSPTPPPPATSSPTATRNSCPPPTTSSPSAPPSPKASPPTSGNSPTPSPTIPPKNPSTSATSSPAPLVFGTALGLAALALLVLLAKALKKAA